MIITRFCSSRPKRLFWPCPGCFLNPHPPLPSLSPPTQSLPERRQDRPFPSSRGFLVLSCVLTATCKTILRHPNRRLRQLSITIQRYFFPRKTKYLVSVSLVLICDTLFFFPFYHFLFSIIPTILLLLFLRLSSARALFHTLSVY